MEFVVLLSVFAITLTQVIARPADTEDRVKTKDGNDGGENGFEGFKFKLPTAMEHNFAMTIEGLLDMSHENFYMALPNNKNDEDVSCKLRYNYKKNSTIEVSPMFENPDEDGYSIIPSDTGDLEFKLNLQAKKYDEHKVFELVFEAVNSGRSSIFSCKIDSFEELNHIQFKEGVKKIKSILFMF